MLDDNWDLINGPDAHDIEVLNYSSQINVLEALSRFLFHHGQAGAGASCPIWPNAEALQEIHRTGTLFLLQHPGQFRTVPVHVANAGAVVYEPPAAADVPTHVEQFIVDLGGIWAGSTPIQIAAFCLWKINWIHPFKNGNGRCARAFMYACLCLKFGFMLPGSPTVIDLINTKRDLFEAALGAADKTFAETANKDCSYLEAFLEMLLIEQLSSVPPMPAQDTPAAS